MMSIDGNGQGEIVVVFLTAVETEQAITEMVRSFKVANPRWTETKVVMSDKDFNERSVFRKEFPEAALHICLFHTLRSFRREVTTEKMSIRLGERDHALEIITKLAYIPNLKVNMKSSIKICFTQDLPMLSLTTILIGMKSAMSGCTALRESALHLERGQTIVLRISMGKLKVFAQGMTSVKCHCPSALKCMI